MVGFAVGLANVESFNPASVFQENAAPVGPVGLPPMLIELPIQIDLSAPAETIGSALKVKVESIKNKRDIAPYEVIWNKQIDEMASYLNELNPSQYPVDLITEQFASLVNAWTVDFNARYNGDFVTDSITLDLILKIAVSGIPNHTNKGYTSIADILSRGIIAQYPLSFVE